MTIIALPKGQTGAKGMAITFPFDVGTIVKVYLDPLGVKGVWLFVLRKQVMCLSFQVKGRL